MRKPIYHCTAGHIVANKDHMQVFWRAVPEANDPRSDEQIKLDMREVILPFIKGAVNRHHFRDHRGRYARDILAKTNLVSFSIGMVQ